MKKLIAIALAATLCASLAAQTSYIYSSLVPKTAKSMAMGGVFSSVPTSEFSFFGNPASFAAKKATFVLPSVDVWGYVRPTADNLKALAASASDQNALMSTALGLMGENGGTGAGASIGGGYAGKGFGLGFFSTTDEAAYGSSPASATVASETEVTAVVGLGLPIELGALRIAVGGDIRPFYRVSLYGDSAGNPLLLTDVISQEDPAEAIYAGSFFGAAVDLGATIELGALTLGLSIRDIAPNYAISMQTLSQLSASFSSGSLPTADASSDKAIFLPDVSAGLAWSPKLLPGLIDPSLYVELKDPVYVFNNWEGAGSALNLLHAGAEVKVLKFISLRGGLNRGWISAGAGVKLLFIDVNASVFTEELGALAGDDGRSGFALQAAIRF